jgi:anti-anti-sigma regulatory factor
MNTRVEHRTLVLAGDLTFDERREFIAQTQSAIEGGDPTVAVNCSTVDVIAPVNDGIIGMLVAIARAAQTRGARIALVRAPRLMWAQFEAAGVAGLFDWRG